MRKPSSAKMKDYLEDEKQATRMYKKDASRSSGKAKTNFKSMSKEEAGHARKLKGMMKK